MGLSFLLARLGADDLPFYQLDLDLYRIGAQVWLAGDDLYGTLPPAESGMTYPYTYPPISAILFVPMTLVPFVVASALWTVLTLVLLALVVVVLLGSLEPDRAGRTRWWVAGGVFAVAAVLEPVRATLGYGQINILLMALVVVDCCARNPRWPRGALIGLAAAVKLTPAAFVLFFLVRRDWRAALTAVVSFLVATAVGFLLAWDDSVRFWTHTVFDTARIGNPQFAGNQSIEGVLARFGLEPPLRTGVWLVAVAVVVAIGVLAMRRADAAGRPVLVLGVNAVVLLAVSPVSWSHHWVWMLPILLAFGIVWWRSRAVLPLGILSAGALIFLIAPQWWFPGTRNIEHTWDPIQQLLGNTYLYFAILVLILAAAGNRFAATSPRREAGSQPASLE